MKMRGESDMVTTTLVLLILIIVLAAAFSLSNGRNDSANAIATVVSTRVLGPWQAIVFSAVLNFVGALFSSGVANTIGREIADPGRLPLAVFLATAIVAPAWVAICNLKGLTASCSHALMGGLIGAVLASAGAGALEGPGILKVVLGAFASPLLGFVLSYILILAVAWAFRRVSASTASSIFGKLQLVSTGAMAFAHGTGDAQKSMGLISGALVSSGLYQMADGRLPIPMWVRLLCAATIGVGTALGGWVVMRTLGSRLAHLRPHQGFAAETAASITILASALCRGIPVSTSHTITGATMGQGAAHGIRAVKWGVGRKTVFAWIFTFPVCIAGGAAVFWLLKLLGLASMPG
jgi:PiT family inorganic phosphate transporter